MKPAGNSGVSMSRIADHDRAIDAFNQKQEHPFDLLRGDFEIIQWRAEARGEDFAARLTFETRDAVVMSVADEGMNRAVVDATVVAVRIRAGKAVSGNRLLASARAFGLIIGNDIALFDDLQTHLIATKVAVMRRGGLPLALFERLPVFVKLLLPAVEMRLDEDKDDDQQKKIG